MWMKKYHLSTVSIQRVRTLLVRQVHLGIFFLTYTLSGSNIFPVLVNHQRKLEWSKTTLKSKLSNFVHNSKPLSQGLSGNPLPAYEEMNSHGRYPGNAVLVSGQNLQAALLSLQSPPWRNSQSSS